MPEVNDNIAFVDAMELNYKLQAAKPFVGGNDYKFYNNHFIIQNSVLYASNGFLLFADNIFRVIY